MSTSSPLFALSSEEFARRVGPIPCDAEIERLAARGSGPAPTLARVVERRAEIIALARAHGFGGVRVVGSVARGAEGRRSDLDVVVSPAAASRGDPVGLAGHLEELLDCPVDVLLEEELPAEARERLLADAVAL